MAKEIKQNNVPKPTVTKVQQGGNDSSKAGQLPTSRNPPRPKKG